MLPALRRDWTGVDEPIARFRNEVDTLFDRFFTPDSSVRAWPTVPVAMWDDEDHVYIEAELPGVTEQDVEITAHNGMLYIRGEARMPEGRNYLYNGRHFGRFERVFALPATVDPNNVNARLADGLLYIELNKSAEAKPKRIAVQKG